MAFGLCPPVQEEQDPPAQTKKTLNWNHTVVIESLQLKN